jgi:hypothetical protein
LFAGIVTNLPVENKTPVGRDRRGRAGKMVRGQAMPRCRAKDPFKIQPYEAGSCKTIL